MLWLKWSGGQGKSKLFIIIPFAEGWRNETWEIYEVVLITKSGITNICKVENLKLITWFDAVAGWYFWAKSKRCWY